MGLDRNALARIDRRLLAELDDHNAGQMVKVPISEALWSARRRNCNAVGMTMARPSLRSSNLSWPPSSATTPTGRLLYSRTAPHDEPLR